ASRDPISLLERGWNTGRIPHRQAAISAAKEWPKTNAEANARLERILLAGAGDIDVSVREMALGSLSDRKHSELPLLIRRQLLDADPELRLLALEYLRKEKPEQAFGPVISLLDDPDLKVVASADAALRRWTGQDFGIRIAQVISSKDASGRAPATS